MEQIKNYIEKNKDRFLEELFELIRIPSVSAKEENKEDMLKAAEHLKQSLLDAGADKADVFATDGHPVLYGEKMVDPSLPTVLVYGHYDVQPAEPFELWDSQPFEPEVRDGKIWARGADDDKGQLFMHVKAFEMMMQTGTLSCNVKFMIEGEEEIGSPSLEKFCASNKDMLKADVILVSDTTMIDSDIPSITTGLRGLAYMEVEVIGPNRDLHSGLYGGAVANPCNMLAKMISSLTDNNNRITIPGFYDDVLVASDEERAEMAKRPFDEKEYMEAIDINALVGEKGYSTHERLGIRPCLDVNGIWGGYIEKGAKTILPSKAYAKISMRLVPDQDSDKIAKLFEDHFRSLAPEGVKVNVKSLHGGQAYVSPIDTVEYQAASKAMEEAFGKKPIPVRSGGSIPIISTFERVLGIKSILMGFGLDSDAIHSPNENYPLYNFYKGIETIPLFYRHYSEMKK
ncbi:MAG: dipeptidase [Marinilabiliaceae bacterium]|jgi:acetylornithine deacetylase/succinyl-diaminopimelate desuccinylase-like protein|nr:dipeptidase [Marinilabiliaceae bacterium]